MILVWIVLMKKSKYREKNNSKTQSQTHTTSEVPENNKNTKSNEKNNIIKRGDPNDVHMSGEELIEQASQDDKVNSILENKNQEDNTKYIAIARRMVDNV